MAQINKTLLNVIIFFIIIVIFTAIALPFNIFAQDDGTTEFPGTNPGLQQPPPPPPPPQDSDGDGVPDSQDNCPNTTSGVPINDNGCELTGDGGNGSGTGDAGSGSGTGDSGSGSGAGDAGSGSGTGGGTRAGGFSILNPIQSKSFYDVIVKFANLITFVGAPLVTIFLVYAGFLFVTARGNDQQLTNAKGILFWTVIGAILVIGAWALAEVVVDFAQGL